MPEEGHLLVDCDYGDQEGHVFTELSNDREWIAFYNDPNERDGHSFVAKMCFPKDLDGIEEGQVKKVRKDLRIWLRRQGSVSIIMARLLQWQLIVIFLWILLLRFKITTSRDLMV